MLQTLLVQVCQFMQRRLYNHSTTEYLLADDCTLISFEHLREPAARSMRLFQPE